MEDLDAARVLPGCAAEMLRVLEQFALHWDGPVLYQSERRELYAQALGQLQRAGLTFECSCTRRELAGSEEAGYPGTCRAAPSRSGPTATRLRVDERLVVLFDDRIQGLCRLDLATLGDFILRRKDGVVSYQLAVVVDDHAQGITDVVRGADLLPSTGWQLALHRALHLAPPRYAHLPLVMSGNSEKLAKSRQSLAIGRTAAGDTLYQVLQLLHLSPPERMRGASPQELLAWAGPRWRVGALAGLKAVFAPPPMP